MVKGITLVALVFLFYYVNAVPSDSKVRRGYDTNGHGGRGRGYGAGSDERDSDSGEDGGYTDGGDDDGDQESTYYGRNREGVNRNDNHNSHCMSDETNRNGRNQR